MALAWELSEAAGRYVPPLRITAVAVFFLLLLLLLWRRSHRR
jgi:hypothetical protein